MGFEAAAVAAVASPSASAAAALTLSTASSVRLAFLARPILTHEAELGTDWSCGNSMAAIYATAERGSKLQAHCHFILHPCLVLQDSLAPHRVCVLFPSPTPFPRPTCQGTSVHQVHCCTVAIWLSRNNRIPSNAHATKAQNMGPYAVSTDLVIMTLCFSFVVTFCHSTLDNQNVFYI